MLVDSSPYVRYQKADVVASWSDGRYKDTVCWDKVKDDSQLGKT
jgi:hypothetical protein